MRGGVSSRYACAMALLSDSNPPDLQSALVRLSMERIVHSAYVAPLGIALVAWVIYLSAGAIAAVSWSGPMLAIALLIIGIGSRCRKAQLLQGHADAWRVYTVAASALVGFWWSASVWFVWTEGQFLSYMMTLCVLTGVATIGMVTMSPLRGAYNLFMLGLLVPVLVHLILFRNPLAVQIAVGLLVMAAVQLWTTRDLHRELVREVDSALRNQELLVLLSKASADLHLLNGLMEEKHAALGTAMDQLKEVVTHDHLTGAYSRRYIFEQLQRQAAFKLRHGAASSLIMFDLDHFKAVNDNHGHPAGDRALQEVVRVVNAQLRDGDLLARVGGEEFLVLLPMTDLKASLMLAERLRQTLAGTAIVENGKTMYLPASFGVATLMTAEGYNDWFRRTDTALHKAKEAGRNTLVAAG